MFEASADMGWVVMGYGGERGGLYGLVVRNRMWNGERVPTVYRTWKRAGRLGPLAAFGHRFWLMAERVKLHRAEGRPPRPGTAAARELSY
jgi:hypothetical protein